MPFITVFERHGIKKGIREGIVESIALDLEMNFAQAGRKLLPKIRAIEDLKVLRSLMRTVKKAKSLDEIRDRLP